MSQERAAEPRGGGRPGRVLGLLGATLLVAALPGGTARAQVAPDFRVGGLGFHGAASPTVPAIYWNPGALPFLRDTHLFAGGTLGIVGLDVAREPIDPASGLAGTPSSTRRLAPASTRSITGDYLLGLSSDLGTDRFSLGLAGFTPVHRRFTWPLASGASRLGRPVDEGPGRYGATSLTVYSSTLALVGGYRLSDDFAVGIGQSVVFTEFQHGFATDLALLRPDLAQSASGCAGQPCGFENPLAAGRYSVDASSIGLSWSTGFMWRIRPTLDLGMSYVSRVLGVADGALNSRVVASGSAVAVLPASTALLRTGLAPSTNLFGRARVSFSIPDVAHLGVVWRVHPRWELGLNVRYANTAAQNQVAIVLSGDAGSANRTVLPARQVRFVGYRDQVISEVRVIAKLGQRGHLGLSAAYDSGATPAEAQSSLAFDGPRALLMLSGGLQLGRFSMGGGYQISIQPARRGGTVFDPRQALQCLASGGDATACAGADIGLGQPTQTGRYAVLGHQLGVQLGVRFDTEPK